jgi:hypothetical protein
MAKVLRFEAWILGFALLVGGSAVDRLKGQAFFV